MKSVALPVAWILALALTTTGCRESDGPSGNQPSNAALAIDSDPAGARIWIDDQDTGLTTPDTIRDVAAGVRDVVVQREISGWPYWYRALVNVRPSDGVIDVSGPLILRCQMSECVREISRYHEAAGIRMALNPIGPLFLREGKGEGIFWPASSGNSYASLGGAVFAGVIEQTDDTVSLGPYDMIYLVSRPAPTVQTNGGALDARHTAWVLPPGGLVFAPTVRALALDYHVTAANAAEGVVIVSVTFRNISNGHWYRIMDSQMPEGGITYNSAYVGFVLDGDIGDADDDAVSYVPDLDLAVLYDSDFEETGFSADWRERPAVLGLRVLERPEGTQVVLNAWPREWDWVAGEYYEPEGHAWLRGESAHPQFAVHPDPRIGHAPQYRADLRVSVSAGPLTLAPGDSAKIVVAVVIAPPAPGTYTPGEPVAPGEPLDGNRSLLQVIAPLLDRASMASAATASALD